MTKTNRLKYSERLRIAHMQVCMLAVFALEDENHDIHERFYQWVLKHHELWEEFFSTPSMSALLGGIDYHLIHMTEVDDAIRRDTA